jgi:hypothetical protein
MPRIGRTGVILCAAAVATACTSITGGSPRPTASPPATSRHHTSSAAPPTALPDEDQIRQTVIAFQDAANTQNWDAYLDLMCAPMRARFTGTVLDYLKKMRTQAGVTTVTITSVSIDGDNAKANFDSHNEAIGSASVSLPLKHEGDGWKICQTY